MRSRARLYHCRWNRIRARGYRVRVGRGRVCASTVFLFLPRHELLHGDREAACCAGSVGDADEAPFFSQGRTVHVSPNSLSDVGCQSHIPGSLQQHRAHYHRGAGRRARRDTVTAHQRLRRGSRSANRVFRASGSQHAADPSRGGGCYECHRSAGGFLLPGIFDGESH